MSLFFEMDAACTDELSGPEQDSLDPTVYVHLLEICARVAATPHSDDEYRDRPLPRPPATQYIRADLVIPDDFVWRTDLSFEQVDYVCKESTETVICYRGGRTTMHTPGEHLRVAVAPDKALAWNKERVLMGDSTLRSVAEAYGVY
jgi:hypothetical protein